MAEEKEIGKVLHYFGHLSVAALKITSGNLKVGDTIHIKGHTTDFTQTIETIQIEHNQVTEAQPGDDIGIKVKDHVREHDVVYKVIS
jgi:putative protease